MSTTDKALSLLALFSHRCPEAGLTELSKRSGFDKATTLRLARSLMRSGLLEQDPQSRRYRLGAEILRLANLREGLYPLRTVAQPVVMALSQACNETVHFSARAGDSLGTVVAQESTRTVRVVVEPGLQIPWHATASGFALLSHLPTSEQSRLLTLSLATHKNTTHDPLNALLEAIDGASERGYALSADRLEHGVVGVAAAVFDGSNAPTGTIAVAVASASLTAEREHELAGLVMQAAVSLSTTLGATTARTHTANKAGIQA